MKFEYDGKRGDRECVAYIDDDGNLKMLGASGDAVCFDVNTGLIFVRFSWEPEKANHKFYHGDKITITF